MQAAPPILFPLLHYLFHFRFCISAFSLLKLCNLLRFFHYWGIHTNRFHFRFVLTKAAPHIPFPLFHLQGRPTCSIQFFHYWSSVIYSVFSLLEQYSIIYSDHYWIIQPRFFHYWDSLTYSTSVFVLLEWQVLLYSVSNLYNCCIFITDVVQQIHFWSNSMKQRHMFHHCPFSAKLTPTLFFILLIVC